MMQGVEFVKNKKTKEPIDPKFMFWRQLHEEAQDRGLVIETSGGCDRGQAGDMMMLGPPFIVSKEQIDEVVSLVDEVITVVEGRVGF